MVQLRTVLPSSDPSCRWEVIYNEPIDATMLYDVMEEFKHQGIALHLKKAWSLHTDVPTYLCDCLTECAKQVKPTIRWVLIDHEAFVDILDFAQDYARVLRTSFYVNRVEVCLSYLG